ncbi:MAG: RNA polymerase sigma factor [bacterium]
MEQTIKQSGKAIDDQEIILRCQRGDKPAFGLLVEKYMQRAYFSALGFVKSHDAALDYSQEAFVRAYRAIKRFDPKRNFFTWYYQILRNLCLNALRDRARRARSFSEVGDLVLQTVPDSNRNAYEELEQTELKREVWRALNAIKPHEKEIILLKDFQDLSYKEIAQLLDCPMGTVMSRLYTARKELKSKLQGVFDEY